MSTVIFYDDALYADTQCTHYNTNARTSEDTITKIEQTSKIFKIADNPGSGPIIVGCVGRVKCRDDFIKWLTEGRQTDKNITNDDSFKAYEYDGDVVTAWGLEYLGKRWIKVNKWYRWKRYDCCKFVIKQEYTLTEDDKENGRILIGQIGSGGDYARGFMDGDPNAGPVEAILCSAKRDPFTNDTLECVRLDDKKPEIIYQPIPVS